jgi:hypothetical protein
MLAAEPRRISREGSDDQPAWERAGSPQADEREPDGPADYLTWQARYIRLIPDEDGSVRFIVFTQGERIASAKDSAGPIDPLHAIVTDKDGKPKPKGIQPDKAVWREAESLFAQAAADSASQSSLPLFNLATQRDDVARSLPNPVPVLVAGIAIPGGQPPPDIWCADLFMIPLGLLRDSSPQAVLSWSLGLASEACGVLRRAVFIYASKMLAMQSGSGDPGAIKNLTSALCREADYWAALELPFHQFLPTVADEAPARELWMTAVRRAALDAFEASIASQDATGRHLRALNDATAAFFHPIKGINSLFPKEDTEHVATAGK